MTRMSAEVTHPKYLKIKVLYGRLPVILWRLFWKQRPGSGGLNFAAKNLADHSVAHHLFGQELGFELGLLDIRRAGEKFMVTWYGRPKNILSIAMTHKDGFGCFAFISGELEVVES